MRCTEGSAWPRVTQQELSSSAQSVLCLIAAKLEWPEVSSRWRQVRGAPSARATVCHSGVRAQAGSVCTPADFQLQPREQPPTQGPCGVLCDLSGRHARAPEKFARGTTPSSQKRGDQGPAWSRGLWGAGLGSSAPRSVPRGFESLVSFLFRGVILRTWCHQRVDGQADTSSLSN